MWRCMSGSTLAQVMAWCLKAPSQYMNQYWLFISEVLWCSPESNFTGCESDYFFYNSGLKIILLKYGSIGSDNGLACHLFQHQAIIWTNAGLLSIWPLGANWIKIQNFSFTKMHLKIPSAKRRPFCAGEMSYELTNWFRLIFFAPSHFQVGDSIFRLFSFNENCCIVIQISLKHVPKGSVDNEPALVQIMAWCWHAASQYHSNDGLVWWHIYSSLSLNELRFKRTHLYTISMEISLVLTHRWLTIRFCQWTVSSLV